MNEAGTLLQQLFAAGDGAIVGRIRLQKIAYLMQARTGRPGLEFEYYHYGPFSRDLADALDREVGKGAIEESMRDTGFGTSYSAFQWMADTPASTDQVDGIPMAEAKALVGKMKATPSVILELAATIHWIKTSEGVDDWKAEIKARKPLKATDANLGRAQRLLLDLDLAA